MNLRPAIRDMRDAQAEGIEDCRRMANRRARRNVLKEDGTAKLRDVSENADEASGAAALSFRVVPGGSVDGNSIGSLLSSLRPRGKWWILDENEHTALCMRQGDSTGS
jgi:hypothetical protein